MPSLGATGGTVKDVSGNSNDVTLFDDAHFETTSRGHAIDFDRNGDYAVSAENTSFVIGTGAFTILQWVYVRSLAGVSYGMWDTLELGGSASRNNDFVLYWSGSQIGYNKVGVYSSNATRVQSDNALTLNEWHLIGLRRKNTGANGTDVITNLTKNTSYTLATNITSTANVFGRISEQNVFHLDGQIASFQMWGRALSDAEIQELYVDSSAPFRQKSIRIFGGVGIPTDTSKIITVKRSKHVEPSYKSGYAQSAGESAHPNLWDGLVGAWMPSLGVTGKRIRDVVGNNHSTVVDDHPSISNWTTSKVSRSFRFERTDNSVSDYAYTSRNLGISGTGSWSVHMRVKVDSAATNVYGWLFWVGASTNTNDRLLAIRTFTDGKYGVAHWYNDLSFAPINYDNWEQIAVTFDGSTEKFYLNGSEVLSRSTSLNIRDGQVWFNAQGAPNTITTEYEMSSATAYNRALSPDEIQTLYVDSLAPFRKKQQVAFNAYPLTLLQKIRSAAKPTTPVSVRVKHNEKPSYKSGYAKSADESASPHLWNGLVGAWMPSLGITGETLRDVSGNGNHGTLTGMDAATDWVATSKGLALDFDGSNDYVDVGLQVQDKLIMSQQASFAMWVKPSSNPVDSGLLINYDGDAANSLRNGIGLRRISDKIRFIFVDSGGGSFVARDTDSGACPINKWSHVCGVWDGSTSATGIKVYINGQRADTTSVTSGTVNSLKYSNEPMTIARVRFLSAPYLFQGRIAHTSIYNRALSPQEIQELYVDSLAPFRRKKSPIGYQPNKELRGLFKV